MLNSLDSYSTEATSDIQCTYDPDKLGRSCDGAYIVKGDCCSPDVMEGDAVLIALGERPKPGEFGILKARNACGSRIARCVCDFGSFTEYATNYGGFYSFDNQGHLIGRVLGVVRDGDTLPLVCGTD